MPPVSRCCPLVVRGGHGECSGSRSRRRKSSSVTTSGDDYFLANYDQFIAYWQKIDGESESDAGRSRSARPSEGRPQLMAIITSPENSRSSRRYKDISMQLAKGEGLTDAAGARAGEGRQGGRLVRRRPARDRSPRRESADRDDLSARQPHRRRDDAHPATTSSSSPCTRIPTACELVADWYMKDTDTLQRR